MVLSRATASGSDASLNSTFASRYVRTCLPKFKMPEDSIPKEAAYQIINDELMLDGNPRLNLASFVTTWMEPECDKLIMDSINKNYVDMDEYPVTTELQNRCVNMIAHLFNAPLGESETAVGVGTVGSSEAIMLAGLAFKRKWQNKMKALGKPWDKPNIVTGANVQVCWEKFARYFEVELKEVKLSEGYYVMDPEKAVEMVDENTICVAAILGSTLNGEFEDVKRLNDLLVEKNAQTGWETPIHVDAASGGFIAPFIYPELEWDFRLPLVKSSSQIIAQYYQLIRLGFEGYKHIMENCQENAMVLKEGLEKTGRFNIVSKDNGVPLVAFSLKDHSVHDEFEISDMLRRFGWIVPAYTMPPDAQHITVLRVVIREDFSRTLAERLVSNIGKVLHELDMMPAKVNAKIEICEEKGIKNKAEVEMQRKYTESWKKFVANKKKTNGMPKDSSPKEAAYQIINDELMLDGNPRLNLASFVTTWMEPECDKLIMDSINKNYVDMDEYPVTTELQNRCVNMIAHLFNAPLGESETAVGIGTVGSSEAIMLAGLAFKRKWQNKMKALGKPWDKPNIVTGANVQVCWEKFARYFEVELKEVKLSEGYYVMDPEKAVEMVDENTICVAAILGSTLNGEFEDVKRLNDLLIEKNAQTGSKDDLPNELIFHINYLGVDQPTFTLNFSKGSSQVIAQYYQLIRLGFEGYKHIMENCQENAMVLKEGLEKTGRFNIVSKDNGVPLVAFSLKDHSVHDEFEISDLLRRFGWIVPAYTMPPDAQHITVLRVVIREDFSRTLAERLVNNIGKVLHELDMMPAKVNAKIEICEEKGIKNKTELDVPRKYIDAWKKFVANKKKTNGVC
ncbi:hypothetical protein M8C21_012179 [Ambrosia artemisiifolia]|uniref:Glutamate decarboxylase n=1 Tax=Ambrosia artemisiifolia TaxID=4212 RepID=A0AAD5GBE9_AMBAR|nr:hypothetical protein M8C21_012179 [Ambrosia artemisiifolia]